MANPVSDNAFDEVVARYRQSNPVLPKASPDSSGYGAADRARYGIPGSTPNAKGTTTPSSSSTPGEGHDWRAYLTDWGFGADIVNELDRIFRTYSNVNDAGASALAYIRGTQWYQDTFPGIQAGEKLGIIGNEQDYRSYTNQLNDVSQRYNGRNVTGAEVAQALTSGKSVQHVNAEFEGKAFIAANQGDLQYEQGAFGSGRFSNEELQAYGQQQAGLDNTLGPEVAKRVAMAHQRLQAIFQGTLATPGLSLGKFGRVTAPSLAGGNSEDLQT